MTNESHLAVVPGTAPRIVPHHYTHSWRFRVTKAVQNLRDNVRRETLFPSPNTADKLSMQLNQQIHALYDEMRIHLDYEIRTRHNNLHRKKKAVFHSSRNQMDAYARALVGQHLLLRMENALQAIHQRDQEAIGEVLTTLKDRQEECVYQSRDALLDRIEILLCEKGESGIHGRVEALNFLRTVQCFIDDKFPKVPFVAVRSGAVSL